MNKQISAGHEQARTGSETGVSANAELRHYLARLARKSRCFSRCPYALECALKLFVFSFNRRQLHKQRFPNYQAYIKDFVYP